MVYTITIENLFNISSSSLDCPLTSPPKPQPFLSLTLQSKISLKSFNRHLLLTNYYCRKNNLQYGRYRLITLFRR
jgi:hypothetical protein